jgi:hypothetical protein
VDDDATSDLPEAAPTPDELEQQRSAVPEDDQPEGADPEQDAPLGDQQAEAAEGDLVEQHQTMPGDYEEEERR